MSVREYLQMREEALGSALDALVEDEREAVANGYRDLARAYCAGQRALLDEMDVVQRMMRVIEREDAA